MWDSELAKAMKKNNSEARRKAVRASISTIATVTQKSPLKISVSEFELFEGNDIILTEHLKERTVKIDPITIGLTTISSVTLKETEFEVGDKVIVMPCQELEQILVVDKVGD